MLLEPNPLPDAAVSSAVSGKDEMNFAEFPIALLTDRVPKGQRSIKFEDSVYDERKKKLVPRKRIIEGSEEYGLPTATDDTVVLALIQLTKLKNDFTRPEVEFTRLELIRLLGWPNEGKSYDRIKLSLLRIKGVNYFYDNAWWDPRQKKWTTKAFSIIDVVEINDSRATTGQGGLFPSRIVWNEVVFDSFQAGFLRNIDFQLCMRLQHPTALRMYRFLGKRFYIKPDWTFDLKEFALGHVGLGGNYEGGTQLARKLQPAIEELEQAAFLEPLPENERFQKSGREWTIRLVQKTLSVPSAVPALAPADAEPPLVSELTKRGVTAKTAAELVQQHPADLIERQIEVFDWLVEKQDKRIAKSPAGYLVESIRSSPEGYKVPKGYVPKAERQAREAARQAKERQAAEARRRTQVEENRQAAARKEADEHIQKLSRAERAALEARLLAEASPETRENYESPHFAKFRDTLMLGLLREHFAAKIASRETLAVEA
jgi:hypothetical protein